jgi:Zn-dependent protease
MFRFRLLPRLAQRLLSERSIAAGSLGGVPVLFHPSGIYLALVLFVALAVHASPTLLRFASPVARVAAAGVVTVLLFSSILAREWVRALAAEREGIPNRGVVFILLGGFAILEREPNRPGAEYRIAIAGPLASVVIALGFTAVTVVCANVPGGSQFVPLAGVLALANTVLASLSAFPALPLDGGRVLRSMLWRWNGSRDRSSWLAARASRWFALTSIAAGAALLGQGHAIGIVAVLTGWFVGESANAAEEEARLSLAAQASGGELPVVSRSMGRPGEPEAAAGRLQLTNARTRNTTIPGRLPSTPKAPPVQSSEPVDETSKRATSS